MQKSLIAAGFIGLFTTFSLFAEDEQNQRSEDFSEVSKNIAQLIQNHHYNPSELASVEYQDTLRAVLALPESVENKSEYISAFNKIWQDGPFSHVRLDEARSTAAQLADYLDTMNVGGNGAQLSWNGSTAVLTVNTMMGMDTIEQIDQAYDEIDTKGAKALIIDLRNNNGGAFAVKPLVEHLLAESVDVGSFASRQWFNQSVKPPTLSDAQKFEPWQGWSIKSFWQHVQEAPVTRLKMLPAAPMYAGPVYVLTSANTASAAELATDALKGLDNVTIIGETTAGQMLSQTMYDLPNKLMLSIPIADYYAHLSGRIEGKGVAPDISVAAAEAMNKALSIIEQE